MRKSRPSYRQTPSLGRPPWHISSGGHCSNRNTCLLLTWVFLSEHVLSAMLIPAWLRWCEYDVSGYDVSSCLVPYSFRGYGVTSCLVLGSFKEFCLKRRSASMRVCLQRGLGCLPRGRPWVCFESRRCTSYWNAFLLKMCTHTYMYVFDSWID